MRPHESQLDEARTEQEFRDKKRRWETALGIAIVFALIAALTGLFVDDLPAVWFAPYGRLAGIVQRISLVLAGPAMLFVALCLEKAKEAERSIRFATCKQTGMLCDEAGETTRRYNSRKQANYGSSSKKER